MIFFPAWLIYGAIMVTYWIYQYATRPKPPSPESRLLELAGNLPKTDEGTPMPMIFGRCLIEKPLLVWHGAPVSKLTTSDPKKYRYGINMLFVAGIPMTPNPSGGYNAANLPILHRVFVNKKPVQTPNAPFYGQCAGGYPGGSGTGTWSGGPRIFAHTIGPSPTGIGGDTMIGQIEFFNGHPDQSLSAAQVGGGSGRSRIHAVQEAEGDNPARIPGYRDQVCIGLTPDGYKWSTPKIPAQHSGFDDAFCIGDTPNPPQFGFEISSYGQNVFGNFHGFNGDADPMEVLYDIITNDWGKVAFPTAQIDTASWQACSNTLKSEQHGYSRCHFDTEDAKRVVGDILAQLGGVMYQEPTNGKLVVKLIRKDYVIGLLPTFTPTSGILRAESFQHGSWQNITNGVDLSYVDRSADYATRMIPARNSGNAAGQANRNRPFPISYPGISNATLAANVAMRELAVVSQPLAKGRFAFDRRASNLRPGDAFRVQNWSELGITSMIFRVVNIDLGNQFDSDVLVDVIQDQWASNLATQGVDEVEPDFLYAPTLSKRIVTEAPRVLQWRRFLESNINDPDVQRVWGIARPDVILDAPQAQSYCVTTQNLFPEYTGGLGGLFGGPLSDFLDQPMPVLQPEGYVGETVYWHNTDVDTQPFPMRALVHTAFPRSAAPGPTSLVLRIKNCGIDIFDNLGTGQGATLFPAGPNVSITTAIRQWMHNVILVGDADNHELMAFEYVTDNGDGTYSLESVWRGLGDTVERDWPVNTMVHMVRSRQCGKRPWSYQGELLAFTRAQSFYRDDSGGDGSLDARDGLVIGSRCVLPLRGQNMRVANKRAQTWQPPHELSSDVYGVKGDPPDVTDIFTEVTHLDGDVGIYLARRNRLVAGITRGDEADEANTDGGVGYVVEAKKVKSDGTEGAAATIATLGDVAFTGGQAWCVGGAGHGTINLYVRSTRSVQPGENSGPNVGTVLSSWQTPCVKITAPRWRNLLANARFDHGSLIGWVQQSGTTIIVSSTDSIRADLSGNHARGTAPGAIPIIHQEQDVSGYIPGRMSARLNFYGRNTNSDANDSITATLETRNLAGAVLDTTSGSQTFSLTTFNRTGLQINNVNSATHKIRATFQFNAVGDVDNNIDGVVAETELILGQFSYNLLSNESFDTGTTASWTVDAGAWVVEANAPGPSTHRLRGGAAALSELHQDLVIPAGWEYGTAVLRFWRMQSIAGDWASVYLRILDASDNVIADEMLFEEHNLPVLNRWHPFRGKCELPTSGLAAKIRVVIQCERSGGAGTAGACFDDFVLSIHKDLDARVTIDAKFDAPSVQPMPQSWQTFHLCYPTLPLVELLNGSDLDVKHQPTTDLIWTDGSFYPPVKIVGQFGQGVGSVDGYGFTRQSGAAAVHIAALSSGAFTGRVGRALSTRRNGFTTIVFFRVNESGFATACGLAGRMSATRGWGLGIDAAGFVRARMRGDGGSKSVTRTGLTVTDGALHMAAITWDPVTDNLHVDDERGRTTISTAAGLGEFHSTDAVLRIGRDEQAVDTLPGDIARVFFFKRPLTQSEIASVWSYGKDPSGKLAAYNRSVPVWCPGYPDDDGDTLQLMASDQVAIGLVGYLDPVTGEGTSKQGIALSRANTNLIPSFDLFGASWVLMAGAARTAIEDATGRPLGASITGANGIKLIGIPVTATTTIRLIVYVKVAASTDTMTFDLYNSADVIKQTVPIVATGYSPGRWKRVVVNFTAWDGSTATARVVIRSNGATLGITHVMYAYQGTASLNEPCLWARDAAGVLAADVTATLSPTGLAAQYNTEGEILVDGVGTEASPPVNSSIVRTRNTTNAKNTREIVNAANVPRFIHYDGVAVPANVNSNGTAIAWNTGFEIRGRWRRVSTLDAANAFAGIRVNANVVSNSYGRAVTWTPSLDLTNAIELGTASFADAFNGVLARVRVTFGEEKI